MSEKKAEGEVGSSEEAGGGEGPVPLLSRRPVKIAGGIFLLLFGLWFYEVAIYRSTPRMGDNYYRVRILWWEETLGTEDFFRIKKLYPLLRELYPPDPSKGRQPGLRLYSGELKQ